MMKLPYEMKKWFSLVRNWIIDLHVQVKNGEDIQSACELTIAFIAEYATPYSLEVYLKIEACEPGSI